MTESYFDAHADTWDDRTAEKDQKKLELMANRLGIQSGSRVLDVGTGTGVFVPFLLSKIGPEGWLVCLDYSDRMLQRARSKQFQGNIEYVCADIASTRLPDSTFDAVVCYSSFPHFKDKRRALGEIGRVLKRGGRLLICHTSSRAWINAMHGHIAEVSSDLIPDEQEFTRLLSAAGFGEIRIEDEDDSYLASAMIEGRGHVPAAERL
jgi:ubiquinone/menaquinone biosynthesis C-methylase UbiE